MKAYFPWLDWSLAAWRALPIQEQADLLAIGQIGSGSLAARQAAAQPDEAAP